MCRAASVTVKENQTNAHQLLDKQNVIDTNYSATGRNQILKNLHTTNINFGNILTRKVVTFFFHLHQIFKIGESK